MSTDKLRLSLHELRQQLAAFDSQDTAARQRLERLIHELEGQLERPHDPDKMQDLRQGLPDLITQFEVEHPRLTTALDQILQTLSNMGI